MVIAVFIVMLASFNLAPRADFKTQQQKPLAEAAITKFLVQHRAAVRCTTENLIKVTDKGDGDDSAADAVPTQKGENKISGCNSSKEGNLCNYLPIGYKFNENEFYSKLYCLNENVYSQGTGNTRTLTKVAGLEPARCRNIDYTVRYVITFGRIPERWKNVSTNKILGDFFTALHNQIPAGASCGIVEPKQTAENYYKEISKDSNNVDIIFDHNPLNSEYVIEGVDVFNKSIPKYFLDNDAEFKSKCSLTVDGQFPCLIYITQL